MTVWMIAVAAQAATLDVKLDGKAGTFRAPRTHDVAVTVAAGPDDKKVEASWDNTAVNSLAFGCTKAEPPADDIVEQVMLEVGADKWALAPGSGVKFSCASGPVVVVDEGGTQVGTFPSPATLTVVKAKARADR